VGNGIDWPVLPGCDQYTLTVEQIEQKEEKRKRMKEYVITENYAGSWCPISHGCGVFCHPPISDESRIPLVKNDRILVTRWKQYWLYGEKMEEEEDVEVDEGDTQLQAGKEKTKGWFPKRCSMEVMNAVPNEGDCCEHGRCRETSSNVSKKKD
jgi:palmitoyltransferase